MAVNIKIRPDQLKPYEELADQLKLDLVNKRERSKEATDFELGWHEDKLAICPPESGPVYVDFVSGKSDHRRRFGGGKNQPLIKAIGFRKEPPLHVVDATAGLAADSFVLASLGYSVTLIEQSPILNSLIKDGLTRAEQDERIAPIVKRMTLMQGNSVDLLRTDLRADVIYLDPMYPHTKKSAQVKKGMQVIQQLVGEDTTGEELLSIARSNAKYRVVVKRPKSAPSLDNQSPNFTIKSPNTRYDIYTLRALK